jgi:hypothetical protein
LGLTPLTAPGLQFAASLGGGRSRIRPYLWVMLAIAIALVALVIVAVVGN